MLVVIMSGGGADASRESVAATDTRDPAPQVRSGRHRASDRALARRGAQHSRAHPRKGLPAEPYEYAEWRARQVGLDYHVDIDEHYYSVPHRLIREQLDARITAHTIELFRKGERVAVHLRGAGRGRHTTIAEHMPSSHRRYAEWTIERIGREAAAIGPSTAKLAALILESRPHPEQGYRACLGILRLARQYGAERLEAACDRGLDIGARSYSSIQSILKHGLDRRPPKPTGQGELLPDHSNIRGSRYYH